MMSSRTTKPAAAEGVGPSARGFRLLGLLDALTQLDPQPSGLQGTLVVGVRSGESLRWWSVALEATPVERTFSTDRPATATTTMLLGEAEAEALLTSGLLPRSLDLLEIEGDRTLVTRFLHRYAPYRGAPRRPRKGGLG